MEEMCFDGGEGLGGVDVEDYCCFMIFEAQGPEARVGLRLYGLEENDEQGSEKRRGGLPFFRTCGCH